MNHSVELDAVSDPAASSLPAARRRFRAFRFEQVPYVGVMLYRLLPAVGLWMVLWQLWLPVVWYRLLGEDPGNGIHPFRGFHADLGVMSWARRTWSFTATGQIVTHWEIHLLPLAATLAATWLVGVCVVVLARTRSVRRAQLLWYLMLSAIPAWWIRTWLLNAKAENKYSELFGF